MLVDPPTLRLMLLLLYAVVFVDYSSRSLLLL